MKQVFNSIVECIHHFAEVTPNKTMLIVKNESITYSEFWKLTIGLAKYLKGKIRTGNKVVARALPTIAHFVEMYATHLLGGVFVPVEKDCSAEKLGDIVDWLEDCTVVFGVTDDKEKVQNSFFVDIDNCIDVANSNYDENEVFTFPKESQPAIILFTTGTTGDAKGIVHRHGLYIQGFLQTDYIPYNSDSVLLMPAPLSHMAGAARSTAIFVCGGTLVILNGIALTDFYFALEVYHANAMVLSPAAINMLLTLTKDELHEYADQIEFIEIGGEKMSTKLQTELLETLPNTHLYIMYASSEGGSKCVYEFSKLGPTEDCTGKPCNNVDIIFVDENWNRIDATRDNPGFITCKSGTIMNEYYKAAEETQKVMKDGYLRMSDYGYMDSEGFVHLLGRASDIIATGGYKVIPTEIENVALSFDEISDCVCFGKKDDKLGEAVVLLVRLKDGVIFDELRIRQKLIDTLEMYKVPQKIIAVDSIQRNKNGKIDRKYYNTQKEKK